MLILGLNKGSYGLLANTFVLSFAQTRKRNTKYNVVPPLRSAGECRKSFNRNIYEKHLSWIKKCWTLKQNERKALFNRLLYLTHQWLRYPSSYNIFDVFGACRVISFLHNYEEGIVFLFLPNYLYIYYWGVCRYQKHYPLPLKGTLL